MYASNTLPVPTVATPAAAGGAVRVADPWDETRLLATLTSAFIDDPPVRWLYPEPDRYLRHFPVSARAFGGGAFESGTSWRTEDFSVCALWCPPGSEPDEEKLISVIDGTVPPQRQAELFALFEAMDGAHPTEPHWYLPMIGVDTACQGGGLGTALLRAILALCDRDSLPAYIEASNPRNIPFYERHGFERRAPIREGGCPPITPMWRWPAHAPGK